MIRQKYVQVLSDVVQVHSFREVRLSNDYSVRQLSDTPSYPSQMSFHEHFRHFFQI